MLQRLADEAVSIDRRRSEGCASADRLKGIPVRNPSATAHCDTSLLDACSVLHADVRCRDLICGLSLNEESRENTIRANTCLRYNSLCSTWVKTWFVVKHASADGQTQPALEWYKVPHFPGASNASARRLLMWLPSSLPLQASSTLCLS